MVIFILIFSPKLDSPENLPFPEVKYTREFKNALNASNL